MFIEPVSCSKTLIEKSIYLYIFPFCVLYNPGWLVSYTRIDNSKPTFIAEGLMNRLDMLPYKMQVTSGEHQQSVLWAGRFGDLEVRKVVYLDNSKMFITTAVVVKNVGTTPITDFYCKHITSCVLVLFCLSCLFVYYLRLFSDILREYFAFLESSAFE